VALVGDADPKVPIDLVRPWADYTTAGFDLKVFPGGHFYLVEHQEAVVAAIAPWVD
jgi:surfactin synthase thioesterase subunit